MHRNIKVSAVQMKILSGKKNLPVILRYLEEASAKGAQIICFPELAFNPNMKKPSEEGDLSTVQEASKKRNIYVIINGYFKTTNKKIYNRTYLISNQGLILGYYDKIYLWTNEKDKIARGQRVKVIKTTLGNIGLCTCWDLFFPEMIAKLKRSGADIIFCPSYWNDKLKKESKFLEYSPTVLAYHHMLFFVYCNSFLKGKTSISQITAPWGELSKIKYREGAIEATLYPGRLNRFKKHFETVLWGKEV